MPGSPTPSPSVGLPESCGWGFYPLTIISPGPCRSTFMALFPSPLQTSDTQDSRAQGGETLRQEHT